MDRYTSNIWKFYVASVLSGFAYFYNGVDTLYFRHFDLSFEQVGFLISANLIATLLLEIPTGSFADVYGKKKSIIIGSLCSLVGLGFLAFGGGFAAFTAGFIAMGIGRAFQSGAESALLYDFLSSTNKQDDYIKHQSRMQSAFVAIDIISGSLGFILFAVNVRIPFIISFFSMLLVIVVQLTIAEVATERIRSGSELAVHLKQIKEGLSITFRSRTILWFAGFTLIYFIANGFFSQILNLPFLQEIKRFNTNQLAIMGLIWNSIQTAMVFFAGYAERKLGQRWSIFAIVALNPLLFFGLLLSGNFLVSAMMLGLYFGTMSFRGIIVDSYLNHNIHSSHRATVLSVNSMLLSSIAIIVLPLLGMIADTFGLSAGMILLIIGTLLLGGLSFVTRPHPPVAAPLLKHTRIHADDHREDPPASH
jgi:MFS family permease